MRLLLERAHVDAIEHDRRDEHHQRLDAEDDEVTAQGIACDLCRHIRHNARHEQTDEAGESVREAPCADVKTDLLRHGQVEHEREVGDRGETCAKSEQGDSDVEGAGAGGKSADDDGDKPDQRAEVACLCHVFLFDPSIEEAGDDKGDQRERVRDGHDAGSLLEGHAEGLGAEGFEQDVLPEDGGEEQEQVEEEDPRHAVFGDGGGHLFDGVGVRFGG
ncbi:MAG: hypothetical protein MZV64_17280 [Ignavibacteriales bacterium]|nr:hypothetical protein [Ignavibacteriales bacterium]